MTYYSQGSGQKRWSLYLSLRHFLYQSYVTFRVYPVHVRKYDRAGMTVELIAECDESRVIRISHILDKLVLYRATSTQEDLNLVAMTTTRTLCNGTHPLHQICMTLSFLKPHDS